jgi:hypothetical protein
MKLSLLLAAMTLPLPAALQAQKDVTVTERAFECIHHGTKIRNTYLRTADPKLLAEAVRIFRDSVANADYPVGTFLQLIPTEAMVKHPRERFPATNGWEFFALELSAQGTRIKTRGDSVVNFVGVTCLSCHQAAARFDFVCEKNHGCASIPVNDTMIADRQNADPRCAASPVKRQSSPSHLQSRYTDAS